MHVRPQRVKMITFYGVPEVQVVRMCFSSHRGWKYFLSNWVRTPSRTVALLYTEGTHYIVAQLGITLPN